jgi:Fe2+ transport system protein FeoA
MRPSAKNRSRTKHSADKRGTFCWLADWLTRREQTGATFAADAQAALDCAPGSGNPAPRGSLTRNDLSLADLKPGECGYVARLIGSTQGRLRLLEMGLTPGTHVKVIRAAAFGGPLDIEVRNYQLSLRREEAASVWLGTPPTAPLADRSGTNKPGSDK